MTELHHTSVTFLNEVLKFRFCVVSGPAELMFAHEESIDFISALESGYPFTTAKQKPLAIPLQHFSYYC